MRGGVGSIEGGRETGMWGLGLGVGAGEWDEVDEGFFGRGEEEIRVRMVWRGMVGSQESIWGLLVMGAVRCRGGSVPILLWDRIRGLGT